MSDEILKKIAAARTGYVEAPAGCGKTEAIARTVAYYTSGKQLILTHTLAGVRALQGRLRALRVAADKYHIDTIAGWAWGWVNKYPETAEYNGPIEVPDWKLVYAAARHVLDASFVRNTISSSYTGILVDEYQDCTKSMHQLLQKLAMIIPCRVLGDQLQGVFGFDEPLVSWDDVRADFVNDLGSLNTPHRWIEHGNEALGRWLLKARKPLQCGAEPDYDAKLITRHTVEESELSTKLLEIVPQLKGSVCIVRAKNRKLLRGQETMLVRRGYRILEASDLPDLRTLLEGLSLPEKAKRSSATLAFITNAYGKFSSERAFVKGILDAARLRPTTYERKALALKHADGASPDLLYDLLSYLEDRGAVPRLCESLSVLRCVLEQHRQTGLDLQALFATEVRKRKYVGRGAARLCVGSTLLVKGLQFAHVVIVRKADWLRDKWGDHCDLYVALSRGARSVTLIEVVKSATSASR